MGKRGELSCGGGVGGGVGRWIVLWDTRRLGVEHIWGQIRGTLRAEVQGKAHRWVPKGRGPTLLTLRTPELASSINGSVLLISQQFVH